MKKKTPLYFSILTVFSLLVIPLSTFAQSTSPFAGKWRATDGSGIDILRFYENGNTPETNIIVITNEDELNEDGDCSLREAIRAANTDSAVDACPAGSNVITDTITFYASGTYILSTQLDISAGGPLVIDGGEAIAISGGSNVRTFYVKNEAELTLESLSIRDSRADYGGGIYNAGTLTVSNSTLSDNTADMNGGGIYNEQSARTTIISSTLSNNSALSGGGIYNNFLLSINSSTLSGNSASQDGGAIYNNASTWLINSTLSGNSAASLGGGIYTSDTASVTTSNCTLSGNSAGVEGGGVYTDRWVTMRDSILANNVSANHGPDCKGMISSDGYNLIGNMEGCKFDYYREGDLTNIDGQLGPLQDNGGPTYTQALLNGSLAIDGGDPDGCEDPAGNPITSDQRGFPRSGTCDIGAYEWHPQVVGSNAVYLPCVTRSCPEELLFDDFSDPNSGWPIFDDQTARYEYLNNEYRILVKSTQMWAAARLHFKATDYVATVDVREASGVASTYGIIFGLSDDWSQFYFFEVRSYSSYAIWRNDSNNLTLLAMGSSGNIRPGTATNQLKIERKGDQIWAYANGQLLNIIQDGNYTGLRSLGLIAVSYDQPDVDVRFDNFALYPIACGASSVLIDKAEETHDLKNMEFDPLENWDSNSHQSRIRK